MSVDSEAVAVIGVGARLPAAADADEYWRNLRAGRECVTSLAEEELLAGGVTPAELADPDYVRRAALVPHIQEFDADFFGMTSREARFSDPQLKLMLEVSHAALENAGLDPTTMGRDVGMFGACGLTRYSDFYIHGRLQQHDSANVVLNNPDYIVTYTAYKLDLHGPAMTVLTACSSSLVAVHLACQSLLMGECDTALAGGANIELPYGHGYRWNPGGVRSRDGHCRPFDIAANGTIFSNGAGVVVLKRLSDAIADRDHIRAVIQGSALHNDGVNKMSFSAPSVEGQRAAVMQAMTIAGVRPSEISYVEAHGTATAVGDPIEMSALHKAYQSLGDPDLDSAEILIGSVKGNIGHTVPTAGVAGLIKLAMALDAEELPPSINFTEPNPRLELDKTPFTVNAELRPWRRLPGRTRWAGISSFGVGGTNAHLVVSEGPARERTPSPQRPRIVVWSGRTAAAADAGRERLAEFFAGTADEVFADSVSTLQQGRTAHPLRHALVAADRDEAARLLRDGVPLAGDAAGKPVTAFLFPGQGSQHARMAAGLYGRHPVFTAEMDRCLASVPEGADLAERWRSGDDAAVRPTAVAQPLLFAVEYALATQLTAWGIRPDVLLGHSVGELAAATVAGIFTPEEGMRLAVTRGRLMQDREPGTMLAVRADAATVAGLLPDGCTVAVVNAPDQIVVAAPADPAVARKTLEQAGLAVTLLATSHAFHSPAMADAVGPFAEAVAAVHPKPPVVPVRSAATGRLLSAAEATDPRFWARQLVEPVLFATALDGLLDNGENLIFEVGPHRALTAVVRKHPLVQADRSGVVPVLPRGDQRDRDDDRSLLAAVAAAWVHGRPVDWAAVRPDEPLRRVPVPGYPYQRQRLWIDPKTGPAAPYTAPAGQPVVPKPEPAPLTAPAPAERPQFSVLTWRETPAPARGPDPADGVALALLPADPVAAMPLQLALQRRGYQVIRVRPGDRRVLGEYEHQVRPGAPDDLVAVLDRLAATGQSPALVVHGWGLGRWAPVSADVADEQLGLGFHSLHALVRAASSATGTPPVLVVTDDAFDVAGGGSGHPVKAMLAAGLRTIAAETPGVLFRMVDLAAATEDDLVAELESDTADPVVALRAGRRWQPAEISFTPAPAPSALRPEGVYLITGGLGGLGLAVARGLAATGLRPRLVLAGRSGLSDDDAVTQAAITELETLGARVRAHAMDVTDARALARTLDITTAGFGPVNGVLHLSGLPGAGMLLRREHSDVAQVLAPKVQGTLALAEAFRDRPPLDFLVSFSSRSALAGMTGNGDYAAANAFLDSYAASVRSGGVARRVLSIGWPAWHSAGMLAGPAAVAAPAPLPPGSRAEIIVLRAADHWELDEHRVDGTPVLPATGHLDLILRTFRKLHDVPEGQAIVLEKVMFALPLAVPKATEVRLRFTPDGERSRFTVTSRPAGSDEAWLDHTGGVIGTMPRPADRDLTVDVAAAVGALPEHDVPPIAMMTNRMFRLGPRWNSIVAVWGDDTTKIVQQAVPAAFRGDLDGHELHPALLDMATSIMRDPEHDGIRLPFMYRRYEVYAPLPGEFYSRIVRREKDDKSIVGDIEMFTPQGQVVGRVTGFTMRRADRASFGRSPSRPAAPAAAASPSAGTGLAPHQGARLLLDLLAARTPAHVLVRPHENGTPVPLEGAGPAGTPVETPAAVLGAAVRVPVTPPAPVGPAAANGNGAAPSADVEDRLRALWSEVLGVDDFTAADDFFDLGGDSMSAVQLMGRIRDVFRVELGIAAIFENPSVTDLARTLREQGAR